MGFNGLGGATEPGGAAAVAAEDVPIPQWNVTAAAPAMKEAASPPAVSTADRLFFIAHSFVEPTWSDAREVRSKGQRSDG
jgi:hypothetical protein